MVVKNRNGRNGRQRSVFLRRVVEFFTESRREGGYSVEGFLKGEARKNLLDTNCTSFASYH